MILHFGQLISIFSLKENIEFVTDAYDPSVGGLEAAIGSFYSRSTNGDFFKKIGSADTDWELILSGGDVNGANIGTGQGTFHSKSGNTLYFRSVAAAPDGQVTVTLDGGNQTVLIKANKYPAAPNTVHVDSSITANQTGLVYQTVAQAATYVASQIPTADLPWQIHVHSAVDNSAFSIGDYVHILSKGPKACKLGGAFAFTGTVNTTNGNDYESFASTIAGFIITGMNLTSAATGLVVFQDCWFPAGKTYSGSPVAANGLKVGTGFNGTVVTRNCYIEKVSISTGTGLGDSIKAIIHNNDKFASNVTPASSFSYGGTTGQFFQCDFKGITALAFGTTGDSAYPASLFLDCIFRTGGLNFTFSGAPNVNAGNCTLDSSTAGLVHSGAGSLTEWGKDQSFSDYVFWPSAPAQTANVFKVWTDMMASIAALPAGIIPSVTFKEDFTIPTLGMPVGGWNMKLGEWKSWIIATGTVTVTIPDGVIIDNLMSVTYGLVVNAAPTTADGMFVQTLLTGVNIMVVGIGAKLVNTGSKALISAGNQVVFVQNEATMNILPSNVGPWVKVTGSNTVLAIMLGTSTNMEWPNDWVTTLSATADLIYVHGVVFNLPTLSAWAGNTPSEMNSSRARNVVYDDGLQAPASGATTVQGVIDWLKTQIGGGGGLSTVAVKTSAYTAASNERVPSDTNSAAFTVQLPPAPAHGDEVEILDVGDFFATNNLTVDRNGNNINGVAANATLNVNNSLTKFVFITSYGWRMV